MLVRILGLRLEPIQQHPSSLSLSLPLPLSPSLSLSLCSVHRESLIESSLLHEDIIVCLSRRTILEKFALFSLFLLQVLLVKLCTQS